MGGNRRSTALSAVLLLLAFGCDRDPTAVAKRSSVAAPDSGIRSTTQAISQGSITDLGTLGGANSGAHAVNGAGDVVGNADLPTAGTDTRAFVWRNGVMTNLGTLGVGSNGTEASYAFGINDAGQVAGSSTTPLSRYTHAVVWSNGLATDLGTSGTLGVDSYSYAYAINDAGDVVGFGDVASGEEHALLWRGGQIIDLGTLGGRGSQARAINNQGQVVGYSRTTGNVTNHAFLWASGVMTDLGTLGGSESMAYGINDAGQVVGSSLTATGETHAFRWDATHGMTDLGTLAGQSGSLALGINAAGQSVGQSFTNGSPTLAVVWDGTAAATDFGNLANAANAEALAVNSRGVAVGISHLTSGEAHAIVWDFNLSPAASAGGPYAGNEGAPVAFNGAGSTDPDNDALTFDWDFGDASPHGTGVTPTHAYKDNGSYTVTLVISDGSLSDSAVTTANISNALPAPAAGADQSIIANVATAFVPSFSDAGVVDAPWTYEVQWGDGTATGALSASTQGPQPSVSHAYSVPGSYVRRLTVTDKDGGTAFDEATITVSPPPPALPNILVLLLDDARFDMVDRPTMPILFAQVADSGVVFNRGYVNTSLCCPSRATMMTGLYQHRTKVLDNSAKNGITKFNEAATIFTALHAAGYVTGNFGKFLNAILDRYKTTVPPGVDEWRTTTLMRYTNYDQVERPLAGGPVNLVHYGTAPTDYQPYVIAREFDRFLTSIPTNKPFLAFLTPTSPHTPFQPDPQDKGKCGWRAAIRGGAYNEADVSDQPQQIRRMQLGTIGTRNATDVAVTRTCETLVSADRMIDSVMTSLRRSGRLANTYIFLTSDNGYHFGEHRLFERKSTLYEEAVRVPLMVRGPGIVPRIDNQHFVQMADITPTALQIAGVPNALTVNGTSMLPVLLNPGVAGATDVLLETLVPSPSFENASGVRNAGWAYMEFKNGDRALYDMVSDPFQVTNLATNPTYANQKATLAARLKILKAK